MRVAYLWGGNERIEAHWGAAKPGGMHMNLLPHVYPCDVLHWDERESWSGEYDLIIVQHFTREASVIAPIREKFPDAVIAIRPDRPPEWEAHHMRDFMPVLLDDLRRSDIVLDAMPDGRRASFWAQLVNKPWAALPSPIVPHPAVDELRVRERTVIVGWLHLSTPREPLPTLAALRALQDHTDLPMVVVNADDTAQQIADMIGLNALFQTRAPDHNGFIDLLSRAKLVIDLFTMHSPGRVATVAAYLGTPTVTGLDTADVGHDQVDGWTDKAAKRGQWMLDDTAYWSGARWAGIRYVENVHYPGAIARMVEQIPNHIGILRAVAGD